MNLGLKMRIEKNIGPHKGPEMIQDFVVGILCVFIRKCFSVWEAFFNQVVAEHPQIILIWKCERFPSKIQLIRY